VDLITCHVYITRDIIWLSRMLFHNELIRPDDESSITEKGYTETEYCEEENEDK